MFKFGTFASLLLRVWVLEASPLATSDIAPGSDDLPAGALPSQSNRWILMK